MIISQDDLFKYSSDEDLMEKEAPVKIDKVSWAERLFKDKNGKKAKVEIQGKAKTEDESRKGWKSAPVEFFISKGHSNKKKNYELGRFLKC